MDFTLLQMWGQMGIIAKTVVVILAIMSVVAVAVTIERLLTYRKAIRESRAFAFTLKDLFAKKLFKEAAEAAAKYKTSHIAPVIRAALNEFLEAKEAGKAGGEQGLMSAAVARVSERQTATLRKGLSALATIGSTAPFVGLFGTTFGIINSFQGMAKEGGGGLGAVAAGIAEALVTTAVGIGVAIVSVLLYNYFTSRAEVLEVDTHESASEVVAMLTKELRHNA
jgi:biopolymer transport protein ExbB